MSALMFVHEPETLYRMIQAIKDLRQLRRASKEERNFWRQFWYSKDMESNFNAYRQAMFDIAQANDTYSRVWEDWMRINKFIAFGESVSADQRRFCHLLKGILTLIEYESI